MCGQFFAPFVETVGARVGALWVRAAVPAVPHMSSDSSTEIGPEAGQGRIRAGVSGKIERTCGQPVPTSPHVSLTGGEAGIRTRDQGLGPDNGLANRRFRPLSHLSALGLTLPDNGTRDFACAILRNARPSYGNCDLAYRQTALLSSSLCNHYLCKHYATVTWLSTPPVSGRRDRAPRDYRSSHVPGSPASPDWRGPTVRQRRLSCHLCKGRTARGMQFAEVTCAAHKVRDGDRWRRRAGAFRQRHHIGFQSLCCGMGVMLFHPPVLPPGAGAPAAGVAAAAFFSSAIAFRPSVAAVFFGSSVRTFL